MHHRCDLATAKINICQHEQICPAAGKPKKFIFGVGEISGTALLSMLASCSPLSLTCGDLKMHLGSRIRSTHLISCTMFAFVSVGCIRTGFRLHATVWWLRAGKIKVKVMNTSEHVLLNIFILCFFSLAMMDYAPQASSVPATLFVAAGKHNGETGIWKWQSCEM